MELDPRRCSTIVAGMPAEQIAEVAEILGARDEHVTMGRFVGHMTDEAIEACLTVVDEPSLLRISHVLEGDDGLERVIELMSPEHLRRAIRAATEHDLWPEALDLLARVPERLAGRLGDLAAEEDDRVLAAMVRTAQEDDLWDAVLPVTRAMSDSGRTRLASLPSIHEPAVLAAVVRSAMLGESWRDLLPLVPLLPEEAQAQVWSEVVLVAEEVPVERLRGLAGEAIDLGMDDMLPDVVTAAEAANLWSPALRLLAALGPDLHSRLAPLSVRLSARQRAETLARARELGVLDELGVLGEALSVVGGRRTIGPGPRADHRPRSPTAAPARRETRALALEERAASAGPSRLARRASHVVASPLRVGFASRGETKRRQAAWSSADRHNIRNLR